MPRTPKPTDHLDSFRHLMGTQPDHEIAKLCDSTPSIVGRYRRKYKIPAYEGYKFGLGQEPPSKKASAEDEAVVEEAPKVAAQSGKNKGGGRSKLDAHREIIGVLSDAEVAGRAGVTPEAVRVYRQRHDIPSKRSVAAAVSVASAAADDALDDDKKVAQRRSSKLDHYMDLVGTLPDREVATMAGVTPENVRAFRRRHDIPARWRDEGEDEVAAPKAEPVVVKAEPVVVKAEPVVAKAAAVKAVVVEAPKVEAPKVAKAEVAPVKEAKAAKGSKPPKAAPALEAPVAPVVEAAVVEAPVVETAVVEKAKVQPAKAQTEMVKAEAVQAEVVHAAPRVARAASLNGYIVHVRLNDVPSEYLIVSTDIATAASNAVAAVAARHGGGEILAIRHLGPALA